MKEIKIQSVSMENFIEFMRTFKSYERNDLDGRSIRENGFNIYLIENKENGEGVMLVTEKVDGSGG